MLKIVPALNDKTAGVTGFVYGAMRAPMHA